MPDLVFSEAEFLKKQTKEDQISVHSSSVTKRKPRRTEKKSRFFKKQDNKRDERATFGQKQQPCAEDDNSSCGCCEILSDYDDVHSCNCSTTDSILIKNENGAILSEDNCGLLYSNSYCSYSQIPSYSYVRSPSILPITTGYQSIDWQIEDNQDDDSDALTLKRDQLDTFWIKRKL